MASDTFSSARYGGSYGPWLTLHWEEIEQQIANNRTKVRLTLRFRSDAPGGIYYTFYNKSGFLQGSSYSYSGSASGTNVNLLLRQRDVWVNHDSNGSKRITFSGDIRNLGLNFSGTNIGTMSVSGTATLTTIPRKSDLTSANISSLETSTAATLSIGRSVKWSGFYHLVTILDGSTWIWDTGYINGSPSTSYTVPSGTVNNMLNRMGTVTSKTFRVRLRTYSSSGGNGYIGESIRNLTVNVHSSVTPSISSVSHSEYVSGLNAQFGAYVQHKSRLSLAMNASAGYGASVRSYRIEANGTSYTSRTATTNELKDSGTMRITFEVTDSRGRKATTTRDVIVLAYSPPQITSLTAERADSAGNIDDEGTHALVEYNVAISPVGNKNIKSFILQYRQNGTDTWQSITLPNASYSYNTSRVIGPLDVDYAFDIQIVVKDYFYEITVTEIVNSTFTLINFAANKRGLAFGATYNETVGGIVQIDGHLVPYFTEVEEW